MLVRLRCLREQNIFNSVITSLQTEHTGVIYADNLKQVGLEQALSTDWESTAS